MNLLIDLMLYVLYSLPLYIIAWKSEHPYAWLAFVPLADLWLMCDMADKDWYWIVLLLLWPLSIIFYAIIWMALAENTNKPAWVGLLTLLPGVGILAAYYMAIYEPKQSRY